MPASLQANGTGSISSNAQVTSLAVPIGSGVKAGDLIFLVASWNAVAAGTTYTTPTGFTVVSSTTDSGASAIVSVGTFYKVADGTEAGGTVTVTHSATGRCAVVSAAFTGVNGLFDGAFPTVTSDNGAVGGQTSESSPSLTGLTQATDIAILLLGAKQDVASATAVTFTQPAGYSTAIQASGTSSAGNNGAAAIAYKVKTDATDETSPGWTTNLAVHWLSASAAGQAAVSVAEPNTPSLLGGLPRIGMTMTLLSRQLTGEWFPPPAVINLVADPDQVTRPLPHIGVVGPPLLQSQLLEDPGVVAATYAIPVAQVAASGPIPVLQSTHVPAQGLVTASGPVPVLQSTHAPGQGIVTASGPVPVLADTFLPAEAQATTSGPTPSWPFAAPVGAVTASGPVPALQATYMPPVGGATASGPLPVLQVMHAVPVAQATASGPTPVMQVVFAAPVAQATASGPVPVVNGIGPAVTQDAMTPLALFGGLLAIPGSMTLLNPQDPGVWAAPGATTYAIPVAQVTATGMTPAMLDTYAITLATATASGMTPILAAMLAVTAAQATASGPTPGIFATYSTPLATATATGLLVLLRATFGPPVATAVALGPTPTVAGILTIIITSSFNTHATGQTASTATQRVLVGHARGQTDSNPHEGRFNS